MSAKSGTSSRTHIPGGFGAGMGAAVVMMVIMAVLRFTTNTISIPELMEDSLVRIAGGEVEAFFISALGVGGKALLLVLIVEGTLLLGGLLGWLFAWFWPTLVDLPGWRWLSGLLYGILVSLALNLVFLPLVGQGLFGLMALHVTAPPEISRALYGTPLAPVGVPVFLNMLLLSIVFGLVLVALLPWNRRTSAAPEAPAVAAPVAAPGMAVVAAAAPAAPAATITRRDFTRGLTGGALALVGGVALWFAIRRALEPPPVAGVQVIDQAALPTPTVASESGANPGHEGDTVDTSATSEVPPPPPVPEGFEGVMPRLVPEITPTNSFYITTKNFVDPTLDPSDWRLNFKGMVDNPYTLTFEELMSLPAITMTLTLACVSNPTGGNLIGNARWKGVDFTELVRRAVPRNGIQDVITRAADGYSDSITFDKAMSGACLLAYEMNGEPLVQKHGSPVRLLVPNIYGMKNTKWITDVELVGYDYKGYWQQQGWSDSAEYRTISRIDYPDTIRISTDPVYIGGIAFAGSRGIKRVEVSTDGGKTWADAMLRPSLGTDVWVQWTYPWLPTPGIHSLVVRATDRKGQLQSPDTESIYPSGASGYHVRQVTVQ
jgi:DMSO/TMAO reductase YedYZ molybdopterin-dependent catalytic subunit